MSATRDNGVFATTHWSVVLAAEERYALEPVSPDAPDRYFDRRWALVLLGQARASRRRRGAGQIRARLGAELGLAPNTIAKRVERLRGRYRELVLVEVLRTVGTPAAAAAELRSLGWAGLGSGRSGAAAAVGSEAPSIAQRFLGWTKLTRTLTIPQNCQQHSERLFVITPRGWRFR